MKTVMITAFATLVVSMQAATATEMANVPPQLLTPADHAAVHFYVPDADLSSVTPGDAGAIASVLYSDTRNEAAAIRAILQN